MSDTDKRPAWMEDELVQSIPDIKLDFLNKMFHNANQQKKNLKSHNQTEILRMLMPIIKEAKAANLSFTPQEIQSAVLAIRKYSTQEELEQIDKLYNRHFK